METILEKLTCQSEKVDEVSFQEETGKLSEAKYYYNGVWDHQQDARALFNRQETAFLGTLTPAIGIGGHKYTEEAEDRRYARNVYKNRSNRGGISLGGLYMSKYQCIDEFGGTQSIINHTTTSPNSAH